MGLQTTVINGFARILPNHVFEYTDDFRERFAIERYLSKMEVPDSTKAAERRERAYATFLETDSKLRLPRKIPGNWYRARDYLHGILRGFDLAPLVFTNGSEFSQTKGLNSVQSKLDRSNWDCTLSCFELWAETAYNCIATRRAVRKRLREHMSASARKRFHRETWSWVAQQPNSRFLAFRRQLAYLTRCVPGDRFSTVPKNNKKDRPIALQPLCNMLVQRRIGNGFRTLLKRECGVDLDTLASKHRRLVSDCGLATIDLKNASDSISLSLVEFLLPKRVFHLVNMSRTDKTLGLDGVYRKTNKVSSMGNGYTFELMSLILYALGREHCESFSVFGDDIIVKKEVAQSLISDLEAVGFVVNKEKSFVDGPFRESCGANFHDDYGYLESYDFRYPSNVHDCIVLHNKCMALGSWSPQFRKLAVLLGRVVPGALRGPTPTRSLDERGLSSEVKLSTYFWTDKRLPRSKLSRSLQAIVRRIRRDYCLPDVKRLRPYTFYGVQWSPALASKRKRRLRPIKDAGKYGMYMFALRETDDTVTGRGSWQRIQMIAIGRRVFRVKTLVPIVKGSCQDAT